MTPSSPFILGLCWLALTTAPSTGVAAVLFGQAAATQQTGAAQSLVPARLVLVAQGAGAKVKPHAKAKGRKKDRTAKARTVAGASGPAFGASPQVQAFAADLAQRHGLPHGWVLSHTSQAQRLEAVRALMAPPTFSSGGASGGRAARNWQAYRAGFLQARRVAAGVAFWHQHAGALARAERQYGVPAQVVIGILGVETFYGQLTGSFRAIDALATLAFDYPPGGNDRSAFFKSELEALLVLAHQHQRSPNNYRGSHAGATGLAQFLPSSIQKYAVDFDGDGRVDLGTSHADAVGSVANYLAQFGWKRDMPTHFQTTPPSRAEDLSLMLANDILPSISPEQWLQHGATLPDTARNHPGLLALVKLPNELTNEQANGAGTPSFVAGTQNFYAITRYNRSSFYAMAVIDLGQAVAQQRAAQGLAR